MCSDKARIALGRAMGGKTVDMTQISETATGWASVDFPNGKNHLTWDPFTDANDDYAVLEWMRNIKGNLGYFQPLCGTQFSYQIGDYACAACAVLEIENGDAKKNTG